MWARPIPFVSVVLLLVSCLAAPPELSSRDKRRASAKVKVGASAPEFTLKDQNGNEVSLRDFRGKKNEVLNFYVFAFTKGCGVQLQNLQKNLSRFEAAETQVIGVSMDSMFANYAFAEQVGISFPLLSDWGGRITKVYGVFNETYGAPRRMAVLIDKAGKVVEIRLDKEAIDPEPLVWACERRKIKTKGK